MFRRSRAEWPSASSKDTSASICLSESNIIASEFTICSRSKYNGNSRQRIIQATGANWLHGHWRGSAGVAYYNGWQIGSSSTLSDVDSWLVFCGQNGGSGYFRTNGATVATSTSGSGSQKLCVNTGAYNELSDWAVAEIMTWDYALSLSEIEKAEAYLSMD